MKGISIISAIALLFCFSANAQNGEVTLEGKFQEGKILSKKERKKLFESEVNLSEVIISITENGQMLESYSSEENNDYQIFLQADMDYTITFSKEGYIPKLIAVNTKGMSVKFISKGYELYTDITLFEELEHINTNAYSKLPVAKCSFDERKNALIWDMDYSQVAYQSFIGIVEQNNKLNDSAEKNNSTKASAVGEKNNGTETNISSLTSPTEEDESKKE